MGDTDKRTREAYSFLVVNTSLDTHLDSTVTLLHTFGVLFNLSKRHFPPLLNGTDTDNTDTTRQRMMSSLH